jgi:D-glycero-alpha-D-manno-heptose-7-phosphate kinase
MIITRSPLRISLGGGGTDLPSYYRQHEGFLISAAIDKYVYIIMHDAFEKKTILKYSKTEIVHSVEEIQHPIIRESLKLLNFTSPNFELASMADIPAGTGLGSSGSFTCALLKALHTYNKTFIKPDDLAEEACHIEIDVLGEPIGKQDQYISAFGGINCFTFCKNDRVKTKELNISKETLYNLEDHLLLFFTGFSRSASAVLKEQDDKSKNNDSEMIDNLHFVKELGYRSKLAFESGDLDEFAALMNIHWERKKQRSGAMSNNRINTWYDIAMKNGALGGKLIGAGGGGFLMFYAEDTKNLRKVMAREGLQEVRFRFDFDGSKVVTSS